MVSFMMRQKLLHRMKEVCGATSRMMKDELIVGNRCETVSFMMRQKLLHRMKEVCGATSRMMKDELIVENIKWTEPSF